MTVIDLRPPISGADLIKLGYITVTQPVNLDTVENQAGAGAAVASDLAAHAALSDNPHDVTKDQVGLGNVPNVDARARSTHTGTQLASTISDFSAAADARIAAAGQGYVVISDVTGATDMRTELAAAIAAGSGGVVLLPKGVILWSCAGSAANKLTIPSGTRVVGHPGGTVIKFTSPASSSHIMMQLSNDAYLADITFAWDAATPSVSGASGVLAYAQNVSGICIHRCKFFGSSYSGSGLYSAAAWDTACNPLGLYGCTNCVFEDCHIAYSGGLAYGLDIIGGEDLRFTRCAFYDNAADGMKIHGDATWGQPRKMSFSQCTFDRNGQVVMQGQTEGTSVTTAQTLATTNGQRIRLNSSSPIVLTLSNPVSSSVRLLFGKVKGSANVTIRNAAGGDIITLDSFWDIFGVSMLWNGSTWSLWGGSGAYTNGEGADIVGEQVTFTQCSATGNQGGGFQIKPVNITNNRSTDIRFVGCDVLDDFGGNGFAIEGADSGVGLNSSTSNGAVSNVSYVGCTAKGCYETGWAFTHGGGQYIYHVTMESCTSRSNGRGGVVVYELCRDFRINNMRCLGNGTRFGAAKSAVWNLIVQAGKRCRISNYAQSGVDPHSGSTVRASTPADEETARDNSANATCAGILLVKTRNSQTMADIVIRGRSDHNIFSGTNIAYYTDGSTAGTVSDFSGILTQET